MIGVAGRTVFGSKKELQDTMMSMILKHELCQNHPSDTPNLLKIMRLQSNSNRFCQSKMTWCAQMSELESVNKLVRPQQVHPALDLLCWFCVVAGVTGLIRGICAVKTAFCFFFMFTVFTGGRPFFSTISAVKTVKIGKFSFFTVFPGGAPLFGLPYPR